VVTELIRGDIYGWGALKAACIMGSLPIIVPQAFCMDDYVSGLMAGAIK
jgi:multiple sugar transport system permease protein